MSGAGIPQSSLANILALMRPDLAAQQMALGQRQQFAGQLLQQQPQFSGIGGAADTVGSKLLGAILQRNSNKQALDLANQYRSALFAPPGGEQPQGQPQPNVAPPLSTLPPNMTPPVAGQPNSGVTSRPLPPLGSVPPGGLQAPQQPVAGGAQTAQPQPQQVAQAQPQGAQGQSMFDDAVPDIPSVTGGDPRKKIALYASDPSAYMKAYYDSKGMTNEYKNALTASGGDPLKAAQLLGAAATKAGAIDLLAEGSALIPDVNAPGGYRRFYGPNENLNEQFIDDPNNPGKMIAIPIQHGADVAAAQAGAVEHARELNKILPDVQLSTGAKVPMFAGDAVNGAAQPQTNLNANNPLNTQPGGVETRYSTPTAGFGDAWDNLSRYGKQGINTVSGIMNTWAPYQDKSGNVINPETPANIQRIAGQMKVDPNQPLNMGDSNVKGTLIDLMKPTETGGKYPSPNGTPQPSASAKTPTVGESTAQAEVNKAAGEAGANSAHINANSDALLKAIDGMVAINDKVPDNSVLPANWKADINQTIPFIPAFKGDAGALANWEQLNSIGVLGGIKNLGLGRVDIPIVKQIQAGGGIPANIPKAQRLTMLQTLRDEVINNRAAAQNTAVNLNNPNAATPSQAQMQNYPGILNQQKFRHWNPQTGKLDPQTGGQ